MDTMRERPVIRTTKVGPFEVYSVFDVDNIERGTFIMYDDAVAFARYVYTTESETRRWEVDAFFPPEHQDSTGTWKGVADFRYAANAYRFASNFANRTGYKVSIIDRAFAQNIVDGL